MRAPCRGSVTDEPGSAAYGRTRDCYRLVNDGALNERECQAQRVRPGLLPGNGATEGVSSATEDVRVMLENGALVRRHRAPPPPFFLQRGKPFAPGTHGRSESDGIPDPGSLSRRSPYARAGRQAGFLGVPAAASLLRSRRRTRRDIPFERVPEDDGLQPDQPNAKEVDLLGSGEEFSLLRARILSHLLSRGVAHPTAGDLTQDSLVGDALRRSSRPE